MKENRLVRERLREEERQREREEELRRFQEIEESQREQRQERIREMKERYQEAERLRHEKKHIQRRAFCEEIVNQMIDLSMLEVDYMDRMEGGTPSKAQQSEWKLLFINGDQLLASSVEEDQTLIEEKLDVLDEYELDNYLAKRGEWESDHMADETDEGTISIGTSIGPLNPYTVNILRDIESQVNPPPEPVHLQSVQSRFSLRIGILGKPFSGKRTIASKLANELNLHLIQPYTMIDQGLNPEKFKVTSSSSDTSVPSPSQQSSGKQPVSAASKTVIDEERIVTDHVLSKWDIKREELIEVAKSEAANGKEISDDILLELTMNEIDRAEDEHSTFEGWIIAGFPNGVESAKLMEERISGYKPLVFEPRRSRMDISIRNIAPEEQVSKNFATKELSLSGLKYLVFIDIPNDEVFARISNQLVDPETNTIYDTLDNPPPKDELILNRLAPIEENHLDRSKFNEMLTQYGNMKYGLMGWYRETFGQVYEVDGTKDLDSVFEEICQVLQPKENIQPVHQQQITESDVEEDVDGEPQVETILDDVVEPDLQAEESELQDQATSPALPIKDLDLESAKLYESDWYNMEEMYIKGVKFSLRSLRELRRKGQQYLEEMKKQFVDFLKQPDRKQEHLTTFQLSFNEVDDSMRNDDEVKLELHKRTTELKHTFWEISDENKERAEQKILEYRAEDWLSNHKRQVSLQHMGLAQLEVNKFLHSQKFLKDVYFEKYGQLLDSDPQLLQQILSFDIRSNDVTNTVSNSNGRKNTSTSRTKGSRNAKEANEDAKSDIALLIESTIEKGKSAPQHVVDVEKQFELEQSKKNSKKKSGNAPKGKKGNTGNEGDDTVKIQIEELEEALQFERTMLLQRLSMIQSTSMSTISEIDERSQRIFQLMEEWIGERYRSESQNISALIENIQMAIEMETPLKHKLLLSFDGFFVDDKIEESVHLSMEGSEVEETQDAVEDRFLFTFDQLMQLKRKFMSVSPIGSNFISLEDFVNMFLILINSGFSDLDLPEHWFKFDRPVLFVIAKTFDPFDKKVVNWKQFLWTLALQHVDRQIPSSSEIVEMKKRMMSKSADHDLLISFKSFMENAILWLEAQPCSMPVPQLKQFIFHLFEQNPDSQLCAEEQEIGARSQQYMNFQEMMLYLSLDSHSFKTVEKAFHVFQSGSITPALNVEQLYELLHFNCPHIGINPDVDDFSLSQLRAVFMEIHGLDVRDRLGTSVEKVTITFEQFSSSALGRAMLKQAKHLARVSINRDSET